MFNKNTFWCPWISLSKVIKLPSFQVNEKDQLTSEVVRPFKNDSYWLYIDDLRDPPESMFGNSLFVSRSSNGAIEIIKKYGMPELISFDHDLGGDDTAMVVVDYIVNCVLDGELEIPANFTFLVHSANPIGAENIRCKMNNLINFCNGK